jgi:hypothetical protein
MAQVAKARAETGDEHALRAGLAAVTDDIVKLRTKQVPRPLVGRLHAALVTGRSACPAARQPRFWQGMRGRSLPLLYIAAAVSAAAPERTGDQSR